MLKLDQGSENPRLQCSECVRWMRLHGKRLEAVNGTVTEVAVQRFYGGCSATGGDHPSGGDVCSRCCPDKCRERLASLPKEINWPMEIDRRNRELEAVKAQLETAKGQIVDNNLIGMIIMVCCTTTVVLIAIKVFS